MSWRVTYTDLESYANQNPPRLSILMVKQPEGYDDQADPSDLPAAALDALRTWLVGAPTSLHVRAPEAVVESARCACPSDNTYPDGMFILDTCPVHGDLRYRAIANPDRIVIDETEEDTQS